MKFSRTVAYAVRATLELAKARTDGPIPCGQLASKGRMPERFLMQILRDLVNHGILRSTRGIDGGYLLGRAPEQISLLDVVEAIDGPLDFAGESGDSAHDSTHTSYLNALQRVTIAMREQLDSVKIAHLMPLAGASPMSAPSG